MYYSKCLTQKELPTSWTPKIKFKSPNTVVTHTSVSSSGNLIKLDKRLLDHVFHLSNDLKCKSVSYQQQQKQMMSPLSTLNTLTYKNENFQPLKTFNFNQRVQTEEPKKSLSVKQNKMPSIDQKQRDYNIRLNIIQDKDKNQKLIFNFKNIQFTKQLSVLENPIFFPVLQILPIFSQIKAVQLKKIHSKRTMLKNNLLVINYEGMQESSLQINFQNKSTKKNIIQFEQIFTQLSSSFNIIFIIEQHNLTKSLVNQLKQLQIDRIYTIIKENQVFLDCNKILESFNGHEFEKVLYFTCLNSIITKQDTFFNILENRDTLTNKLPLLLHENLQIIVLPHSSFENFEFDQISFVLSILNNLEFYANQFEKLDNLEEIFKTHLKMLEKQSYKQQMQEKINKITETNNVSTTVANYGNRKKYQNLQQQTFQEFKSIAQQNQIQGFANVVYELFNKNTYIKQSNFFHRNKECLNKLDNFDYNDYQKENFELESLYFQQILKNIHFVQNKNIQFNYDKLRNNLFSQTQSINQLITLF